MIFGDCDLTLTDGECVCARHPTDCPSDRYRLTPMQRALVGACQDPEAQQQLLYTALVENRVRALAKDKGVTLPPDFTVRLSMGDPSA